MPSDALPAGPPAARRPAGRAYLGLALLGWGLSILLGVTPHEDPLVGAGLSVFGVALLATAPRLPEVPRLPAALVAALGVAVVLAVVGHMALFGSAFDLRKAVLLLLGLGVAACAPILRRRVRVGRRGRTVPVSSLVVAAGAVLGAPLAAWAVQAATATTMGTTPSEMFVRGALLVPLSLFLHGIGLAPAVDGQTITYATPRGPMAVEVGAACSGVQAMALFTGVLALFLWVERPGGRRLATWSAIGIAGVYAVNLLRLGALTLVGYQWGAEALQRFHAQAGWIFFVAWAVAFAWLARRPRAARAKPGAA